MAMEHGNWDDRVLSVSRRHGHRRAMDRGGHRAPCPSRLLSKERDGATGRASGQWKSHDVAWGPFHPASRRPRPSAMDECADVWPACPGDRPGMSPIWAPNRKPWPLSVGLHVSGSTEFIL